MKALTKRENDIMEIFWREGASLFMSEVVEEFAHQNLHFNTVATIVRGLERKGFVGHETFGHSFLYFPIITKQEYGRSLLENIISRYYDRSYFRVVREFVENGKISAERLHDLISNKAHY